MTNEKSAETTLKKTKSRGYWQVRIYPTRINTNLIQPINSAKETMRNLGVHLRGWDYPHFPTINNEKQALYVSGRERLEAWVDTDQFKEVWRLYNNGQFIHLMGVKEDWWDEDTWVSDDHPLKQTKPLTRLEVISAIYQITEIYVFFSNYANSLDIKEVETEISLHNTKGRQLVISDPRRAPLFAEYKAWVDVVELPKKTYTKEQLSDKFKDLAFEQIMDLFHQFSWDNPPEAVIREDQRKLIERQI